jgi:hypothetical protein
MKPRFVDDMRNVTVEQGQDATFTCTISDIHVSIFRLFTHIHPCDSGAGTERYIHLHHIRYSCEYIQTIHPYSPM